MSKANPNSIINRRQVVGSMMLLTAAPAGLAVAGAEFSVPAKPTCAPDPIFAAIEKYRRADAHHGHCCGLSDDSANEAGDASFDAMIEMVETVPTTLAGAVALLKFIESRIRANEALIDFVDAREEHSITPAVIKSLCAFLAVQS